jgi:hypothetical protein
VPWAGALRSCSPIEVRRGPLQLLERLDHLAGMAAPGFGLAASVCDRRSATRDSRKYTNIIVVVNPISGFLMPGQFGITFNRAGIALVAALEGWLTILRVSVPRARTGSVWRTPASNRARSPGWRRWPHERHT